MPKPVLSVLILSGSLLGCDSQKIAGPAEQPVQIAASDASFRLVNSDEVARLYMLIDSEMYTRIDPSFLPEAEPLRLRLEPNAAVDVAFAEVDGFQPGISTTVVVTSWTHSILSEGQWLPQNVQMHQVKVR